MLNNMRGIHPAAAAGLFQPQQQGGPGQQHIVYTIQQQQSPTIMIGNVSNENLSRCLYYGYIRKARKLECEVSYRRVQ